MCVLILLRITRAKKSLTALVISGGTGVKVIDRESCMYVYVCVCVYAWERESCDGNGAEPLIGAAAVTQTGRTAKHNRLRFNRQDPCELRKRGRERERETRQKPACLHVCHSAIHWRAGVILGCALLLGFTEISTTVPYTAFQVPPLAHVVMYIVLSYLMHHNLGGTMNRQ